MIVTNPEDKSTRIIHGLNVTINDDRKSITVGSGLIEVDGKKIACSPKIVKIKGYYDK